MKKILLISIVILAMTFGPKQSIAQTWLWANSAGGTDYDKGNSVATDVNGNVIVTGYFTNPTITFGTTILTNAGSQDIFIVKYDASGNVLWAKSGGGSLGDYGQSVTADASGNVIVTGRFGSPSITFGTTTLTNSGISDIFIVKYDASGNILWAKSEGGSSAEYSFSVVTDVNNNVIVTGFFVSPTITFGSTTLLNSGSSDIFIVKYDASGNVLWAKSAGGTSEDRGYSVATDANGNVFVTGSFQSLSITFGTTTLSNAGNYDIFIVKYDAFGNMLWVKSAGGTNYDGGNSIASDSNGNVIVTGHFWSSSITFGAITLTNAYDDIFIVKYDASGNVLWVKSAGGTSGDSGTSVATDSNGNVIVTGYFEILSITFGTTTLTNASNVGYTDIFIVKYDASGNMLWANSIGGIYDDEGNSVATDANGNIIVTGYFVSPTVTFGTTTLSHGGLGDIFIAKLDAVSGVNEWSKEESFSVYPNPSDGNYSIELDAEKNETITISLFDLNGKIIDEMNWNVTEGANTLQPNWNNLVSGVFFVKISSETGEMNVKLVVD